MLKKIKYTLALIVKKNKFLYKIWFLKRVKISKSRLPELSDDLYLGGYPRTGNTFISDITKSVFPKLKFSHHLHTIAVIKIALDRNISTVILIRNPLDTISSYYYLKSKEQGIVGFDKATAHACIIEYIQYYSFVSKIISKITIFDFSFIVKHTIEFLEYLNVSFEQNLKLEQLQRSLVYAKNSFKKGESNKKLHVGSLPNKQREEEKEKIKSELVKLKNFQQAENIYNEVIKFTQKPK